MAWGLSALSFALGAAAAWGGMALAQARRRRRDGRFLSFVGHEINTPLTSIHMTALNFTNGVFAPLSREHEPWMRLLQDQVSWLNHVVAGLRDFVHLEYLGDFRPHRLVFGLAELAGEVRRSMEGSLARAGAELELDIPRDLSVRADRERLAFILASVIAHARKFRSRGNLLLSARPGGGAGRFPSSGGVDLRLEYQGGPGASADAAELLDLYYPARGNSSILPCVGTGLGLCRVLLERQGGSLAYDADISGRARIRLFLPPAPGEGS